MYKAFKVSGPLEQKILGLSEIKAEDIYIYFQNATGMSINQQNSWLDFLQLSKNWICTIYIVIAEQKCILFCRQSNHSLEQDKLQQIQFCQIPHHT